MSLDLIMVSDELDLLDTQIKNKKALNTGIKKQLKKIEQPLGSSKYLSLSARSIELRHEIQILELQYIALKAYLNTAKFK